MARTTTLGWWGVAFVWLVSILLIILLVWAQYSPPVLKWIPKKGTFCRIVHKTSVRKAPDLGYRYTVWVNKWDMECTERFYLEPTTQ